MTLTKSPKVEKPTIQAARILEQSGLEILLSYDDGKGITVWEPVSRADFSDPIHEAWLENCLRKGKMGSSPEGILFKVAPILSEDSATRCLGYTLELPDPDGAVVRSVFSMRSLENVARRAADRLVSSGVVQKEDKFQYELHSKPNTKTESDEPADLSGVMNATVHSPPIHYLEIPLKPLLKGARPSDPLPDLTGASNAFPVFLTEEAFKRSEHFSRKGAEINPYFESGAVLIGSLCSCPDTGEFFVVVSEVFEVKDAEQTVTSLSYSGKSWARIQNIIRARSKAQPALRILGQAHGHNFLPNDGKTCEACPTLPTCDLTNLFASQDDQDWSRAIFSGQPWQLCLIFAMTARSDQINGLFGLHDGRLSLRGFHLLPDFKPDQYPTITVP